MSAEILRVLGPRQFNRFLNARNLEYSELRARAQNAEARYYAAKQQGEFYISEITRNIRNRITVGSPGTIRDITRLGSAYDNSGVSSYRPPGRVLASAASIENISPHISGIVAIYEPARYSTSRPGHISRRGRTTYYRVSAARPRPVYTEAQAARDIEARLAANPVVSSYRAIQARYQTARARVAAYKILG